MKNKLLALAQRVWAMLSHNLGFKLLSVFIAIFLWSYVIYSNPNITRSKTISNVPVTISGQSVLTSRMLALLTDLSADLVAARVQVDVSQSSFALVNADNVRVELDLSSVRKTGKQAVKLSATSTYGRVTGVWPEYVEIEVEKQDQRYVPVNGKLIGEEDPDYWYNINRINPAQIVVTGPTSLVRNVSSAQVDVDVSDRTAPHIRIADLTLMDAQGQPITALLSQSTSSVTVGIDIYPTKTLPILAQQGDLIDGKVRRGFRVTGVEVNPESVLVAADQALLDSLSAMMVEPVNVSGADHTFTTTAPISTLKGIKNLSSTEVGVTVLIEEDQLPKNFYNVHATLVNPPDSLSVEWTSPALSLHVTGPYTVVWPLSEADLTVEVDLSGLGPGVHELPVRVSLASEPALEFTVSPPTVKVTVKENAGYAP